jgi:hypothetical protein
MILHLSQLAVAAAAKKKKKLLRLLSLQTISALDPHWLLS